VGVQESICLKRCATIINMNKEEIKSMEQKADIGLIGLAVMGENLVLNMESHGFTVAVYNRTVEKVDAFTGGRGRGKKIIGTHSLQELAGALKGPRKVMLMVKAGKAVDDFIELTLPYLEPGDCIIDGGKPVLWIWLGLVFGLGFENKINVLFLIFGLFVGLLLTKQRRLLITRRIWLGVLVASFLMLPNIIWQTAHNWPTLEFINNARMHKMIALPPAVFFLQQIVLMQPLTFLVWGTGLACLLVYKPFNRYRSLGWCYITVLAVFIVQGGKAYYLVPIYPLLFAAGSIAIERWLADRWKRAVIVFIILCAGIITAPLGMPLLSVESFINYQNAIGLRPSSGERFAEGRLPSFYANMFGWKKLTAMVDTVYRSLPVEDQTKCGIFCQNYLQAGAIDFYGQSGLPHAICGHNSYWLWGMRGYTGDMMIVLGSNVGDLKKYFGEATERARFHDEYIQPIHNDLPVFVVRKPKQPLAVLWLKVKDYI